MLDNLLNFHEASSVEKSKPEYGLMVARDINNSVQTGWSGYYNRRNSRYDLNRRIAAGRQDMTQFLDLMGIDGKDSFVNLDLTPPAIAPKFMAIIIQRFLERSEKLVVSAIDPYSVERKNYAKLEAEYRMRNKDMIAAMEEAGGFPLEDPEAITPKNRNELEVYFGPEYQLPEEIGFEKGIDFVLLDNDWEVCKKRIITDLTEKGLGVTKVYVDSNGKIRIRPVIPENSIYSWSEYEDFRDIGWCGELIKIKVPEYRDRFYKDYVRMYGEGSAEKMLFEDIKKANTPDPKARLQWLDSYAMPNYYRPYDDWSVEVIEFEVKTLDTDIYQAKKNAHGKLIAVDKKKRLPQRLGENKEIVQTDIFNIYKGSYVRKVDKIFNWGKCKNMIRPQSNLSDVYFSYSFYMYENRDMVNMALPERMQTSINQLTLAHLMIQRLIAAIRPPGLKVDIRALQELDLGLGKTLAPLDIMKIYNQTGNIFYKSWNEDPTVEKVYVPMEELANAGSVAQLQELIATYNFYLERLRDDIGTNEFIEGQGGISGKTSPTLAQNQVVSGNRATEFIYDGYTNIFMNTGRRIAILLWDNIMYGGEEYRGFVGDDKIDESRFDIKVEPKPTAEDRAALEQAVNICLQEKSITLADAHKIRSIDNMKLAYLYLAQAEEKVRQDKMAADQANIQATAQAQIQSAQAAAESNMAVDTNKGQMDMQMQQLKIKGDADLSLQKFVQDALLKTMDNPDAQINPLIQSIIDSYLEGKANQEMAEQQMAEAMMGAAMEQSGGQPPAQ